MKTIKKEQNTVNYENTQEYVQATKEFLTWQKQKRESISFNTRRKQFEKRKKFYEQFIDVTTGVQGK